MKLTVVLSVLVGTLALACSTVTPVPVEPTPNIDATVEAKVAQERAVDATVEAKVSGTLSAPEAKAPSTTQAACKLTGGETVQSGWTGEDTGDNSCNSCFCTNGVLGCTKMACPAHQVNSDSKPTPTRPPTPTTQPTRTPKPTLAATPVLWGGMYTMLVDQSPFGEFAGKTVRFKIGASYASQTATWEMGGFTSLNLTVASLIDGNVDGNVSTSRNVELRTPPHLFTGKGFFGGMHVPIGTVISAWVDGVKVSETTVVAEPELLALGNTHEMFYSLGTNLRRVWIYLNYLDDWKLYVPGNETPGINTYTDAKDGDIVWVLVNYNQGFQNEIVYEGWNLILLKQTIAAVPAPSVRASFGDGTWIVGSNVQAGRYRSSETGNGCYWQRLSGLSGDFDDIIVNELTDAVSVVEISSTDAGFSTENCGTWTEATSAITSSLNSPFGDGAYVVGLDIGSGTWTSPGGDSCYWARLSGFSGELKHIEANGLGGSNNILTIKTTDNGFESSNCGTWTKTG